MNQKSSRSNGTNGRRRAGSDLVAVGDHEGRPVGLLQARGAVRGRHPGDGYRRRQSSLRGAATHGAASRALTTLRMLSENC